MPSTTKGDPTKAMFRDPSGQGDMFERSYEEEVEARRNTPVTCLGMDFPNDDARREYFLGELAKKLQDPEFRRIEGFPIGEDEDILALSDPPYYTACPNPWIADFIKRWEAEKPRNSRKDTKEDPYHREPFVADVSEGKNDPIYSAHSYHTKVPHKAIMRFILHYTEPGDIIFDGFCGTGMSGVAAQLCGDRDTVASLGYQVKPDGKILQEETDAAGKKVWKPFSKLGARRAVLNDLSPAATFIAYNYNAPVDVIGFEREAKRILKEIEDECGWMYETLHVDGKTKGRIDYTVWSEVFICPDCDCEVVFLEEAMDKESKRVMKTFTCPHCSADIAKKMMERAVETVYDDLLTSSRQQPKRKPVEIVYRVGKEKHSKIPDEQDIRLLARIAKLPSPQGIPLTAYPYDDMWEAPRMLARGITHVHHLFMPRQLRIVALLWSKALTAQAAVMSMLLFWLDQSIAGLSLLNRYGPTHFSQVNRQMSGVCYVPSQLSECSPWYNLSGKLSRLTTAFRARQALPSSCTSGTGSSTVLRLAEGSVDYIFIDPPFGDNFAYADLNFLVEAWLGVRTHMAQEAIVDRAKKNRSNQKGLDEYRRLMTACFTEAYRVLKPGRWMTVEFSNTKASVWNGIQTALAEAGFIIANVAALDKQQMGFKAVTTPTAVKQDLVISAYKPNGGFEERFKREAETEAGVWDFVRTHMKYLPVTKQQDGLVQPIPERDPRILFDQMVAYYVRKGYPVPLSSQEFQIGLAQRFDCRDGMYFLSDQAAEYAKFSASHGRPAQMSLFVSDEASAIDWLRSLIGNKPQTFADINPQFMKELGGWSKHEKPLDLRDLLNQNFLCYDGKGPVPEQIHAYLSSNWKELRKLEKDAPALVAKAKDRWYVPDPNKAGDLERLRERALLREFWEYLPEGHKPLVKLDTNGDLPGLVVPQPKIPTGKRMRIIRTEAVRVGFKYCWQHQDYRTIVAVAKRIPEDVLQEDPKLLMWYDQALTRLGEE